MTLEHTLSKLNISIETIVFQDVSPSVVITDADKALMKALAEVFPRTFNQIFRWHIQQNIMKHCRQMFDSMLHFENFMSAVKQLAVSNTEKDDV
ncbi:hypothetical protein LIPSTDRAFT_70037 [Lipomyces starkeyi NRRL Y-11557]|uniref:MULE transposase domain-containing protein n=1 Tax=Lipomyces starkeyi NRRL Y-11557 TaxID=675824 RepID=A0A1E3Q9N5_LIPST|nr:hypothetical protein LIPSTDRAFT_70037 [Lipomyces starkeyi NRRL Y-11557]